MDRREDILTRLQLILQGISGYQVYRARGDLPNVKRPALLLLDADEEALPQPNNSRPAHAPYVVIMRPEIVIVLATPDANRTNVGAQLNAMRVELCRLILNDPELIGICTSSGYIRYEGCITDLGQGRDFEGKMTLVFAFAYIFKHSEF